MTSFFPLLYQILRTNCKFLRNQTFCGKFWLQIAFLHTEWPHFGESAPKKTPIFWCPHRMTPFFRRNLTPNAPCFRSLVGTCTSLSYSSAPGLLTLPSARGAFLYLSYRTPGATTFSYTTIPFLVLLPPGSLYVSHIFVSPTSNDPKILE